MIIQAYPFKYHMIIVDGVKPIRLAQRQCFIQHKGLGKDLLRSWNGSDKFHYFEMVDDGMFNDFAPCQLVPANQFVHHGPFGGEFSER